MGRPPTPPIPSSHPTPVDFLDEIRIDSRLAPGKPPSQDHHQPVSGFLDARFDSEPVYHRPAQPDPYQRWVSPERSNAVQEGAGSKKLTHRKSAHPPPLDATKYSIWKRGLQFWLDLYSFVDESVLLSTIGLRANACVRPIVIKFTRDTRLALRLRAIHALAKVLDDLFEVSAKEKNLKAIDLVLDAKRELSKTVSTFWIRFEGLLSMLENPLGALSPDLLFTKCFRALNFSSGRRSQVLMYLERQGLVHSVENLKMGSIKLFGAYRQNGERKLGGDISSADAGNTPSEIIADDATDQEVLLLKRKGSRNRPGNESIRKSIGGPNVGNSFLTLGKGAKCFRCGSPGHMLRDCPLRTRSSVRAAER